MLAAMGFSNTYVTGLVMTGLGFLFMLVSVMAFFDRALLILANALLLSGLPMIMGLEKTLRFFNPFEKNRTYEKILGIALFFTGLGMLIFRRFWVCIAFLVEVIGLFQMFGSFLPKVLVFLRTLPYVGPVLSAPGIREVLDWIANAAPARKKKASSRDNV
jgi:hypothetical protein